MTIRAQRKKENDDIKARYEQLVKKEKKKIGTAENSLVEQSKSINPPKDADQMFYESIYVEFIPILKFDGQRYLPIERVGGGTFSDVYKVIDLRYDDYVQDSSLEYQPPHDERNNDINTITEIIRILKKFRQDDYAKLYYELSLPFMRGQSAMRYVALKRMNPTANATKIQEEIAFLLHLKGKYHVSPLITALRQGDQVLLVLPYFKHQDPREYIPKMTGDDIPKFMFQLFQALCHCHKNGVIHRDIKPGNYLYSLETKQALLVDFGLAEISTESKFDVNKENFSFSSSGESLLPQYWPGDKRQALRAPRAGTRGFRAPEILFRYPNQTSAIDMWSAGVVLLCLITKRFPFFESNDDDDALVELALIFGTKRLTHCANLCNRDWLIQVPGVTKSGYCLKELCLLLNKEFAEKLSEDYFDLLERLLDCDFTTRITAEQALSHPLFQLQ